MDKKSHTKWVGLLEVSQAKGVETLGVDRGAHVTVVAWCSCESDYREKVSEALMSNGLCLELAEEIETCEVRLCKFTVSSDFMNTMNNVGPENPVEFMEFHTFPIGEK